MNNNNYKKTFWSKLSWRLALIMIVVGNFSCKKIEDVQSTRLATDETNWKTYQDAQANLLSVYGLVRSATVADNGHWILGDLRKGDFVATTRADLKSVISDQLNASYPVIDRLTNWRRYYAAINAASLFIERSGEILANDPKYTAVNNKVDIAQARMLRAFCYFYISRIWGDVPLLTSSHDGDFVQRPRTAKEKVLAYCTSEILEAAKVVPFRYGGTDPILPGLYYNAGWSSWNGVLWTRLSAYIILSHIAAWQGNYIDAANYSEFVLDNMGKQVGLDGAFSLTYLDMSSLTENGNSYSPFAYKRATLMVGFGFEYGNGVSTANGHIEQLTLADPFVPKSQPDMFVPKDTILKAFTDPADLRFSIDPITKLYRTNYFYGFDTERPIFNKIKVLNPAKTSGNFAYFSSSLVFSRLEEITLLRAEALAVLGKRDEAIEALKASTALRGVAAYDANSTTDIIDAVFAERRRELMGEGWRWYDIIRYNRIKKPTGTFIANNGKPLTFAQAQSAGALYWPVASEVLRNNPQIKQNTFWQ